jgi:hypothetical protein
MWKVKTRVIPVIIGATGTISKSFRKYISNTPVELTGTVKLVNTNMYGQQNITKTV